jgi:hypothetical protein
VSTEKPGQTFRVAGIKTTAELLAGGWTERRIRTAAQHGDLVAIRHGAYANGTRARELLGMKGGQELLAIAAAAAVVGPEAVVSHESAAFVHGIDMLSRPGSTVTLTRAPERGWRSRAGVQLHAMALPPEHVTVKVGMAATTPARTIVDFARTVSFREAVVAADSALYRKLTTKDELHSVIAACRRLKGISRANDVVDFADRRAESPLESIARVAFKECGLPIPELQVWLGGSDQPIGRVDFYWRHYRTIAEVDGAIKYSDPLAARAQLKRDSYLRAEGYELVHFDWNEITQTPELVAATIRVAFARGRSQPRRPQAAASGGLAIP